MTQPPELAFRPLAELRQLATDNPDRHRSELAAALADRAVQLLDAGDLEQARQLTEEAVAVRPGDAEDPDEPADPSDKDGLRRRALTVYRRAAGDDDRPHPASSGPSVRGAGHRTDSSVHDTSARRRAGVAAERALSPAPATRSAAGAARPGSGTSAAHRRVNG